MEVNNGINLIWLLVKETSFTIIKNILTTSISKYISTNQRSIYLHNNFIIYLHTRKILIKTPPSIENKLNLNKPLLLNIQKWAKALVLHLNLIRPHQ
jgi:hypothetical protein